MLNLLSQGSEGLLWACCELKVCLLRQKASYVDLSSTAAAQEIDGALRALKIRIRSLMSELHSG